MKLKNAVEGFLTDWQLRKRSTATIRLYRSCLMVLVKWLTDQDISDVESVTIHHLRAFMLDTQNRPAGSINPRRPTDNDGKPPTAATLRSYVKAIKVLFKWLTEEEVLVKNPALRLAQPALEDKMVVSFQPHHLQAMFDACDLNTSLGFRDYVLMLTLVDTGLRVAEVCSITLDNVHEDFIKVFGKGKKEREVGISPVTAKYLWKYINMHRTTKSDDERTVFTNLAGRKLTTSGVQQIVERVKGVAQIDDVPVTPHKFRHTFARTWLERGGDVYSLSRLMGHSNVKITEIYLKDFQSRQARVHHAKYSSVNEVDLRAKKGRIKYRYGKQPKRDDADTQ